MQNRHVRFPCGGRGGQLDWKVTVTGSCGRLQPLSAKVPVNRERWVSGFLGSHAQERATAILVVAFTARGPLRRLSARTESFAVAREK